MSSETEIRIRRYGEVVREADEMGRLIGVRRLRPSEQTKLIGFTSDLEGSETVELDVEEDIDGEVRTVKRATPVSHRLVLIVAAAVCEIDNIRIPFPRNRGELDAILDRLDSEGLAAASRAIARLAKDNPAVTIDDAKNL